MKLEQYRRAVVAALKERDTLKWANTDKRSMLREHYEAQRKYANAKSAYRDFYKKHCKKD